MNKRLILSSVFFFFISSLLLAQDKIRISGNVLDDQKQPVVGATILVKGTSLGTFTDASGNYSIEVPKDAKTLVVSYTGFKQKEISINTGQGNYVLNVDLVSSEVVLNETVVSASKKKEKLLDAPASISVIGQDKLERNVVTTPVDQLKTTPGVDIMRTGLVSSNVVVRGFNNIFSGSVLNVVDNRIGAVPSLRINAYQLIPTSSLDFDRIEVVRGPASALYGPNASSGVIHIMTKSPLEQEKKFVTTIAMTGGFTVLDNKTKDGFGKTLSDYNRGLISGNIINPEIRHSGKLFNGKFGYKLSGSYFQAQDYPNYDDREPYDDVFHPNPDAPYAGDTMVFGSVRNGMVFVPDTISYSTDANGNIIDSTLRLDTRVFKKKFFIRKYTFDGRIDIQPIKDITVTVNGGMAGTHNIELTGLGAAQGGSLGRGWIYWYLQARFKWKNLYLQYFINSSDAGNTYLIPQLSASARNGYNGVTDPYQGQFLVDKSKLHGIQVQHSWNPIEKLGLVYGVDVLLTRPNTNGTINGRFEDKDNLNQVGGYIQGDYEPLKWLKVVAAFRVDYNSIIKGASFSPRGALVFKPATGHNIRVTYNRAFAAPTTLNQFLDLSNGLIPNGINVRGIGNPYGWAYSFDESSKVVQFKAAPWGGSVDAAPWITYGNKSYNAQAFDSLANYVTGIFANALGGNTSLAQSLVDGIFAGIKGPSGTVKDADQLSVDYANFATTKDLASSIQNVANFRNLKKIDNSTTQTLELGYKGLIAGKLSIQLDAYWTRESNYVSALRSGSGAVMMDHISYLGSYDNAAMQIDTNGRLYKNLYANNGALNNLLVPILDGQAALQNPSIVPSIAGSVWDEFVVMTYQFPMGVITPNDPTYVGADYIVTFQNLGRLDVFGIDFGFQYNAVETDHHNVTAGGSLSWVNKDNLKLSSGEEVPLNAPKVKASVTLDHTLKKVGFGYGFTFRYQMGYEANSAVYEGYVKPAYLLDARVSYRPSFYKGLLLSINVNNLPNYQWRSFPGTPLMGTQFYAKAQVTF